MERFRRLWIKLCEGKNEHKIRRFLTKSIQYNINLSCDVISNFLADISIEELLDKNLIQQHHQGYCEAILIVPEKLANNAYFAQGIYRLLIGKNALKYIASLLQQDDLHCTDLLLYPNSMSTEDFQNLLKIKNITEIFGLNENSETSARALKLLKNEVTCILLSKAIDELLRYRLQLNIDKEINLLKDYLEDEPRAGEILAMSYIDNKISLKHLKDQLKFL